MKTFEFWKFCLQDRGPRTRSGRRSAAPLNTIGQKVTLEITTEDLEKAELYIQRSAQRIHFAKELEEVTKKGIFTPNSRCELKWQKSHLSKLDPYMDKNAILRVGSRLLNAEMDEDAKCPMILPRKDSNVRAMLDYVHKYKLKHAGPKHMLNTLRQEG